MLANYNRASLLIDDHTSWHVRDDSELIDFDDEVELRDLTVVRKRNIDTTLVASVSMPWELAIDLSRNSFGGGIILVGQQQTKAITRECWLGLHADFDLSLNFPSRVVVLADRGSVTRR